MNRHRRIVDISLFLLGSLVVSANAQDYLEGPHWIGAVVLPAPITSAAAQGTAIYVTCDNGALFALDAADPDRPVIAAEMALPHAETKIIAQLDGVLYVASDSTLGYVDARIPLAPFYCGEYPEPVIVADLAFDGPRGALLARQPDRILVLDSRDPLALTAVSQIDESASQVAVLGDHLVYDQPESDMYDTWYNLVVVDIATPSHPREQSRLQDDRPTGGREYLTEFFIHDGKLVDQSLRYVISSVNGYSSWGTYLVVYDISLNGELHALDDLRLNYGDYSRDCYTSGIADGRFAVTFDRGQAAIVQSSGSSLIREGWLRTGAPLRRALMMANHVYGSDDDGVLHVFDLGDLSRNLCRGQFEKVRSATMDNGRLARITVGSHMQLGALYTKLEVDSVGSNEELTTIISRSLVDEISVGRDLDFDGDLLVVTGEPSYTIDVSEGPTATLYEHAISLQSFAVVAAGLGVGASSEALTVYDITDPASLTPVAQLGTGAVASVHRLPGVAPSVVAVKETGRAIVVDLGNPTTPEVVAEFGDMLQSALPVADSLVPLLVTAQRPAEGCPFARLGIYEVDNPANPVLRGEFDAPGIPVAAQAHGNLLSLACGTAGVLVVDLADLAHPSLLGGLMTDEALVVDEEGGHLHIWEGNSLAVVDLSGYVPTELQIESFTGRCSGRRVDLSWRVPVAPSGVTFRVHRAVACAECDVQTCVSDGVWTAVDDLPAGLAARDIRYELWSGCAAGAWNLVTTALVVVESPRVSALVIATPNPFNPQVAIRYDVATPGPLAIRVFDLRGRLVRTLLAGAQPAGSGEIRWDGLDEQGGAAAAGTYLVRLDTADRRDTLTITLVR